MSVIFKLSRTSSAFLVVPLVMACLFIAWSSLLRHPVSFADFFAGVKFLLIFLFPTAWVVGVPGHVFLRSISWTSLWHYILGGAIGGLIASLAFLVFPRFQEGGHFGI